MKQLKLDSSVQFFQGIEVHTRIGQTSLRKRSEIRPKVTKDLFRVNQAWMVWHEGGEYFIRLIKDRNHIEGEPWPKPMKMKDCEFLQDNVEVLLTSDDLLTREMGLLIAEPMLQE